MSSTQKILVVDDNKRICDSVSKILIKRGYLVDCALDAEEAVRRIGEKRYNLVIIDVMMPKVSGMDLLKTIRKEYRECNVIMITGYPSIGTAVEATHIGARGYIEKPFTPDELTGVVKNVLEEDASASFFEGRKFIWYFEKNNNVLVADDEAVVCNSVKKILLGEGYAVDCAFTTEEAVEKFKKKKYALTLLDLKIPSVGGIELLREIKEGWPDARTIIITGYASVQSAVESIKLGAESYIQKPFTPEELTSAVKKAMSRRAI